jgi:UPF0716 protein FxsA
MRLALLAIALPLAEIAAFVIVGRWIGVLPVLGLVVLAALAGVLLVKSTGPATAARVQSAMRGRENPLLAVGSAAFRVVAGLLLLVPGFITDILAIFLLLPPVQAALIQRVAARGRMRRPADGRIIEGEAVEISPPPGEGSGWTRH